MVKAWEAKGAAREALLRKWMANSDCNSITLEIITSERFMEF